MSTVHKVSPLLGESFAIEELRDFIVGVSILNEPVLFTGEAGTGKGLAASKIHAVGRFAWAPHRRLVCSRFQEFELERTLFGQERDTPGLLHSDRCATCYISGIEHLTPRVTSRLVRHLLRQEKQPETRPRLIFGSRLELEEMGEGRGVDPGFLDLISRYHIRIPPLHERIEDIPILCNYQIWLNSAEEEYEERWEEFRELVLPDLLTYPWPGNVTELNEVVRTYCGLPGVDAAGAAAAGGPVTIDGYYLGEALRSLWADFLATLDVERLTGRHDLVLGRHPTRRLLRDDAN